MAILPLIESAKGILNAYEIAGASPLVEAITFGGEDFTQDIGATRTREGREIFLGRSMLVIAAKAAGVQALDTVFSDFNDEEGLRNDTLAIKQMGFDGRAAIHPSQIEIIHEIFTPTEAEIQHAVNVIRASEIARGKGSGVAVVKGKMIDKPIIERAEKIIRIAERLDLPIPAPKDKEKDLCRKRTVPSMPSAEKCPWKSTAGVTVPLPAPLPNLPKRTRDASGRGSAPYCIPARTAWSPPFGKPSSESNLRTA